MADIQIKTTRQSSMDQKESASKSMKDYNNASSGQLKIIQGGKGNIQTAVPLLPPHDGTIQIADFGCSYGRNSMFVMRQLLDEIQKREDYAKDLKKMIFYHEDLPDSDFEAVKNCVMDPEIGYPFHDLVKSKNIKIHTECIGKTYYEQIVESNNVDIAFCYTSLHWMPEYREHDYGLIYSDECGNRELTQWFNDISEKYLTKWLDLRYKELKQGGLLSFNIMTYFNYVEWFNRCWAEVFKRRGWDYKDFNKVNLPIYIRSSERLSSLLKQFEPKFKVISSKDIKESSNFSRAGIRAGLYNQIVVGLAQYPNIFKDEASRIELYEEFESICFEEKDYCDTEIQSEWIVLQKL